MTHPTQGHILIVENDDGILRSIAARLGYAGYSCLTATSGSEGMSLCVQTNVALVITDLQMPGLDGVGLISLIRASSTVPIVVITAYAKQHDRLIYQYDDVTILSKPFESEALLDLVETELALAQYRGTQDADNDHLLTETSHGQTVHTSGG